MWIKYNPNPTGRSDGVDCAVRAVARALNTDWETAYALISINGFIMGDVNCSDSTWGSVLREHGFYMTELSDDLPQNYTVEDFARDNPHGTYVLKTDNHAVAVVDGNIYDSWDSSHTYPIYVWYRKDGK